MDELQDNPYASTNTSNSMERPDTLGQERKRFWRAYLVTCIVLGMIPIYGHFVHVARDEQFTVLILILAWVMTCCNIIVCFIRAVLKSSTGKAAKLAFFTALLIGLAYFGYYGIENAILELWA